MLLLTSVLQQQSHMLLQAAEQPPKNAEVVKAIDIAIKLKPSNKAAHNKVKEAGKNPFMKIKT